VLRKKPPGKLLASAHAIEREYRVLAALHHTQVHTVCSCFGGQVIVRTDTELMIMQTVHCAFWAAPSQQTDFASSPMS